jgi:hypothetical protein
MGTAEILIVFSTLMALIALVTIGIDWIGKPLKHRRFIPRMYRFDDEKLPVDEYGNTTLGHTLDEPAYDAPQPYLAPLPYVQPGPYLQPLVAGHMPATVSAHGPLASSVAEMANPTIAVPTQPPLVKVPQLDPVTAASSTVSKSAFTDSLATPGSAASQDVAPSQEPDLFAHSTIAGTETAMVATTAPEQAWAPGMAFDMTVDDQKPSLAIKAERFWMATAEANSNSHFDQDDVDRMASGKAPRRLNPITKRIEAMQLTGLRQASDRDDVRMHWPDNSVDPWSSS